MRNIIDLKANADLKLRYKALLREEWEPLLEKALQLVEDQLRLSGIRVMLPLEATEDSVDNSQSLRILNVRIEDLVPILQRLHSRGLPPVPEVILEKPLGRNRERYRTAIRVAVCLMLQAYFELHGEDGLFRDMQSLVFLGTVYELLPRLNSARFLESHNLLVNVLAYHCTVIWRDDAAHQQYLLGILAGYANDKELEGKSLLASFRLTDPGEHDYLTKAQACLFYFLEHRRYEAATSFLMSVCRQAPKELLDELGEMLKDVYTEEAVGKR